ncbi:MAG: type II toxin-antitoxin system YhaV family toxin [Gemmatimonadota bacterium]
MPERSRKPAKENKSDPSSGAPPITVKGWTLFFHEHLLDQLERLTTAAELDNKRRIADAGRQRGTPATSNAKVLRSLHQLMFEEIPDNPNRAEYRQGSTLGSTRAHWFRAKFEAGRFRLFFRFHSSAKIIVYAWVNDDQTLRTYGSPTDAYRVFAGMLDKGDPPDTWDALLKSCQTKKWQDRAAALVASRSRG